MTELSQPGSNNIDSVRSNDADVALSVRGLSTSFRTGQGLVTAVSHVSFDLMRGEALGIVGESGCGKSVTARSIMRLLPDHVTRYGSDSRIEFNGDNLLDYTERQMRDVRGDQIGMIFQEPMTALNPVFTIGSQIDEALVYHTTLNKAQRRARVLELLDLVEIPNPDRRYSEYPHQLSGGMRQRIVIAMALACEPEILIADEPTTALDVTIQSQILRLMNDLRKKSGTAILLITHDLGVVAQMCDRVVVMYAGQIVETAGVDDLFHDPAHPYSKALLESIPHSGTRQAGQRLTTIPGMVPGLHEMPEACRFAGRCSLRQSRCDSELPELRPSGHQREVRCHFPVHAAAAATLEES
jgi:peptide/nickel transport system ATP-binding protein/oligopeptide transport system ATP-binding protein